MRAALAIPEARIEVIEWSRYPAPAGEIVFLRKALRAPGPSATPNAPVLWRGEVRYAGSRRFAIWARVSISALVSRVHAVEPLPAGAPVSAAQLRLERGEGFPLLERDASSMEQVVRRKPRRTVAAGSAVRLDWLANDRQVERGDTVEVRVHSGAARLAFTGRAESAGSIDETVRVRNPATHCVFTARVSGKRTVVVDMGDAP
jgi:flagella basal body P-ring formation protein FlgA